MSPERAGGEPYCPGGIDKLPKTCRRGLPGAAGGGVHVAAGLNVVEGGEAGERDREVAHSQRCLMPPSPCRTPARVDDPCCGGKQQAGLEQGARPGEAPQGDAPGVCVWGCLLACLRAFL